MSTSSRVPNTPEARHHAAEAREIDEMLREYGIEAEQVAPTRDNRGHVRLNFDQVRRLIDYIDNGPPDNL